MGLVVLQEWWGMNEQIIARGKELAEMGNFVTLVPDLYRGKVAKDHEEAGHLSGSLDWAGAIEDIRGAALFLMGKGCRKVGVTGYCMGGALSIASAALVGELSAAAPFYGIPKAERCDVKTIIIPIQAHFGELDTIAGFSAPADARAFEAAMKGKKDFELFMYPAGHGFTNSNNKANYNKESADLALSRTVKFMARHLCSR
ncbi:protein usf-like isoform X6 [Dreissena polymorpha]|nr:protein usf-like isoform X2 [Dreissena polymorpha]XP_052286660.1 protein usf-like isoform X3 [Dreissena polymorpha]XP_052286661.1 protein usf-like isoform X4 [Dreissena polymorpha]XP_052286663.1 protein usf-like isoform X5 [Dreissena polymorpha]XP_052286664.1 protein usf-like isoform X6 [Dreissena polymorpha]